MKSLNRIKSVSVCLTSALLVLGLGGCDGASPTVASNAPTTNQHPVDSTEHAKPLAFTSASPLGMVEDEQKQPEPKPATRPPTPEEVNAAAAQTPTAVAPMPIKQDGEGRVHPAASRPQVDPAAFIVKVEPLELDMGDIPTNDTKKSSFTLINTGDKPMTVVSIRTGCGCTMVKFTPNTVLQPKEELPLEVSLSGGARPGAISGKTVTITVEGQPDTVMRLKGMAISFVTVEPGTLDPETMPEGKFTLKATDGTPFRVMSAQPTMLNDYDKEPKVQHELSMSWEKYRAIGINRQAIIYLDHPKCQQVTIPVNFSPQEVAKQAAERNSKRSPRPQADTSLNENGRTRDPNVTATPVAEDGDTQLYNLILNKKNDEVLKRIATGMDVNARINSQESKNAPLLGVAGKVGNVELVKALLETKKVEIEATDDNGRTPLMHAATSKNVEVVRELLKAGASVSVRDMIGNTALTWGAGFGNGEIVQELLDAGSEVEVAGSITGWTPLIWAAAFGDPQSLDPLIKARANIEAADFMGGTTPLIFAMRTGRIGSVQSLLKHGAKVEAMDHNGNTALLACASASGCGSDKLQVLLEAGANIHAKDNRGFNALTLARKRTDVNAASVIKVLEPLLAAETPADAPEAPKTVEQPTAPPVGGQAGH